MHGTPLLSAKGNHDQEYNSGASDYDDHYKPTSQGQQPPPSHPPPSHPHPPFNGAQQHYPPPPPQQAQLPPPALGPPPPQPPKDMSDPNRGGGDSKSIGEMGKPLSSCIFKTSKRSMNHIHKRQSPFLTLSLSFAIVERPCIKGLGYSWKGDKSSWFYCIMYYQSGEVCGQPRRGRPTE